MNTFGNLGGFLGPMVLGYAVHRWNSWTLPFYVSAAVYAVGALLWLAVRPEEKLAPG
jgi:MFS family permease